MMSASTPCVAVEGDRLPRGAEEGLLVLVLEQVLRRVVAQPLLRAQRPPQRVHALGGAPNAFFVQLLRAHRIEDRGVGDRGHRGIERIEQHVHAGIQRLHRRLSGRHAVGDRLHLHRVADDDPLKAQFLAQQILQDGLGERRRRLLLVERRVGHMGGHHHRRRLLLLERLDERREIPSLERADVGLHLGAGHVRIELGGAVTGKVLHAGGDPRGLKTSQRGQTVGDHRLRRRAESARTDHRVRRFAVHVQNRSEDDVDSDGAQLVTDPLVDVLGQIRIVRRSQRRRGGSRRREMADVGDEAALLVDADERRQPASQRAAQLVNGAAGAVHRAQVGPPEKDAGVGSWRDDP